MAGFVNAAKHSMLASIIGRTSPDHSITHISLHTSDPGTTGTNEVTGGDPAYARASVSEINWASFSEGEISLSGDISFNGPAAGSISHFGIWDSSTFLGSGSISGDTAFNSEGEFVLQAATKLSALTP